MLLVLRWVLSLAFATNEFLLVLAPNLLHSHAVPRDRPALVYLARIRGRNMRNVIIVGEGRMLLLIDHLRQEASLGYRILRIIDAGS